MRPFVLLPKETELLTVIHSGTHDAVISSFLFLRQNSVVVGCNVAMFSTELGVIYKGKDSGVWSDEQDGRKEQC